MTFSLLQGKDKVGKDKDGKDKIGKQKHGKEKHGKDKDSKDKDGKDKDGKEKAKEKDTGSDYTDDAPAGDDKVRLYYSYVKWTVS